MVDVEWNDNAKAAVMSFAAHMGYERTAEFWLEDKSKPKQTKTVADSSQQSCSEGEKWTHTHIHSQPCRVEIEKPDEHGYIVVYVQRDGYVTCLPDDIEPIKPPIAKAAAWDKLQYMAGIEGYTYSNAVEEIYDTYEVIDG